MEQIRLGTFETNSSSTHTLIIMTEDQLELFKSRKLYIDWENKIYTKEEWINKNADIIKKSYDGNVEDFLKETEEDGRSYDSFMNTELETFEQRYTTPSGEKIVAIGKYGYQG